MIKNDRKGKLGGGRVNRSCQHFSRITKIKREDEPSLEEAKHGQSFWPKKVMTNTSKQVGTANFQDEKNWKHD